MQWSESALTNPTVQIFTESVLPTTTQAGQIAAEAGVKRLVLTHLSPSVNETGALADVRQHHQGEVLLGSDLLVIELTGNRRYLEKERTTMDTVNYEKRAPIASITINRPHVMNACDPPTTDYIYECEQNFDQDPDLKVLILTGTGERAFCTGMDLKAAAARIAEGGPVSNVVPPYMKTEKITIAAVNGYAVAGGLERALACDIRIASENAQFGCFEIRRGIPNPPDPLIRLIGFGPALHMLLSGDVFHAEEALRFGLVTKVVPPSELMSTVEALAQRMAEYPIEVLKATKKAAFTGRDMATHQSELYSRALAAPIRDSDISREGVTAFAERRKANFK